MAVPLTIKVVVDDAEALKLDALLDQLGRKRGTSGGAGGGGGSVGPEARATSSRRSDSLRDVEKQLARVEAAEKKYQLALERTFALEQRIANRAARIGVRRDISPISSLGFREATNAEIAAQRESERLAKTQQAAAFKQRATRDQAIIMAQRFGILFGTTGGISNIGKNLGLGQLPLFGPVSSLIGLTSGFINFRPETAPLTAAFLASLAGGEVLSAKLADRRKATAVTEGLGNTLVTRGFLAEDVRRQFTGSIGERGVSRGLTADTLASLLGGGVKINDLSNSFKDLRAVSKATGETIEQALQRAQKEAEKTKQPLREVISAFSVSTFQDTRTGFAKLQKENPELRRLRESRLAVEFAGRDIVGGGATDIDVQKVRSQIELQRISNESSRSISDFLDRFDYQQAAKTLDKAIELKRFETRVDRDIFVNTATREQARDVRDARLALDQADKGGTSVDKKEASDRLNAAQKRLKIAEEQAQIDFEASSESIKLQQELVQLEERRSDLSRSRFDFKKRELQADIDLRDNITNARLSINSTTSEGSAAVSDLLSGNNSGIGLAGARLDSSRRALLLAISRRLSLNLASSRPFDTKEQRDRAIQEADLQIQRSAAGVTTESQKFGIAKFSDAGRRFDIAVSQSNLERQLERRRLQDTAQTESQILSIKRNSGQKTLQERLAIERQISDGAIQAADSQVKAIDEQILRIQSTLKTTGLTDDQRRARQAEIAGLFSERGQILSSRSVVSESARAQREDALSKVGRETTAERRSVRQFESEKRLGEERLINRNREDQRELDRLAPNGKILPLSDPKRVEELQKNIQERNAILVPPQQPPFDPQAITQAAEQSKASLSGAASELTAAATALKDAADKLRMGPGGGGGGDGPQGPFQTGPLTLQGGTQPSPATISVGPFNIPPLTLGINL
jgi:hypothetical protein